MAGSIERHVARFMGVVVACGASIAVGCSQGQQTTQPEPAASPSATAPTPAAQPAPPSQDFAQQPAPIPQPAVLGSTAPPPAAKMREIEPTPEAVAQGKALFGACMGCHGEDAGGRVGIGPRIASESYLQGASDRFLINTITKGRAGTTMIPWGTSFKPEQIQTLVAYLRSIHPTEPVELDESALKGDIAEGEKIFTSICSGCHGNFGGGYQETANGTGIGRKAFLDTATNGFIRHVVKHGKTLTPMKGFAKEERAAIANLTDTEVDSTIAYLRKNAW